jgi:glycosyl transferase, probable teichoic acid biosynthesis protein
MCHRIHEESETSKTISNNTRSKEDLETLEIFWPKWFAKILMKQYVKSQKTNG